MWIAISVALCIAGYGIFCIPRYGLHLCHVRQWKMHFFIAWLVACTVTTFGFLFLNGLLIWAERQHDTGFQEPFFVVQLILNALWLWNVSNINVERAAKNVLDIWEEQR